MGMKYILKVMSAAILAVLIVVVVQVTTTDPKPTEAATSHERKVIMRVSRSYYGVPYVLGGESRNGMDCTGFSLKVYRRAEGIYLPHNLYGQYEHGWYVSKSRLKRGDLVFFAEHGGSITHVAIYAGRGYIWHASSYFNQVTKSEMKYVHGYYGARRLT
jgi:cell wall-associated NlpC family hydrolase